MRILPLGHLNYCKLQFKRRHYSSSKHHQEGTFINKQPRPSLWQILVSVLGALFGVQSTAVHERDFTEGRPWWVYGIIAVIVVLVLVILLVLLAKYIVAS